MVLLYSVLSLEAIPALIHLLISLLLASVAHESIVRYPYILKSLKALMQHQGDIHLDISRSNSQTCN